MVCLWGVEVPKFCIYATSFPYQNYNVKAAWKPEIDATPIHSVFKAHFILCVFVNIQEIVLYGEELIYINSVSILPSIWSDQ